MTTKEITISVGFSAVITVMIMIWQGIENLVLASITFLIVIIMYWLSYQR